MKKIDYKKIVIEMFYNTSIKEFDSYKKHIMYNKLLDDFERKLNSELKNELENALCEMFDYYLEREEELVEFTIQFMKNMFN